jgi:methionyl-tRNA formyltransferase
VKAIGLRLAFAGTPEFAAVILRTLLSSSPHQLTAAYTLPDRPTGRGRKLAATPVGRVSTEHRVPLFHIARATDFDIVELARLDALIVAAFGLILPAAVLAAPRLGCINVHASLLPRWRGAAPIQHAILAGDRVTGISIMQMDAGLDTGDILLQESCPIETSDTAGTLHDRLAMLGGACLLRALDAVAAGRVERRTQDDSIATYARKIQKSEAILDWSCSAAEIVRKVRAFNPVPVATAVVRGLQLRIWEACEANPDSAATPGQIVACNPDSIDVAAGSGTVRLLKLQLPGRNPVTAHDFLNAHPEWRGNAGIRH